MQTDQLLTELTGVMSAYVAGALSGRLLQDIEDTAARAAYDLVNWAYHRHPPDAELSDKEQAHMIGTSRHIMKRRVVDFIRQKSKPPVAGSDNLDNVPEKERGNVSEQLENIDLAERMAEYLRKVTTVGTRDRELIDKVLAEIYQLGEFPSLRRIGKSIWPKRPNTACEHWVEIVERALCEMWRERNRS